MSRKSTCLDDGNDYSFEVENVGESTCDHQFRDITSGIREGFQIEFDCNKQCKPMGKNMRSARQNPAVVTDYLLTECAAGRVIGPFE